MGGGKPPNHWNTGQPYKYRILCVTNTLLMCFVPWYACHEQRSRIRTSRCTRVLVSPPPGVGIDSSEYGHRRSRPIHPETPQLRPLGDPAYGTQTGEDAAINHSVLTPRSRQCRKYAPTG